MVAAFDTRIDVAVHRFGGYIPHVTNQIQTLKHFFNRWRALWNPPSFHGWGRRRNYFEGWYLKVVTADLGQALAVIPGISYEASGAGKAFIQVMDGTGHTSLYHEFPVADFRPEADCFAVRVGSHFFSESELRVDLPELQLNVRMHGHIGWPRSRGAPGIMGWYGFVPFMECYHDVIAMHCQLSGSGQLYQTALDFNGGRGYAEKDWGTSFPSSWIWMQSNHFPDDAGQPVSLFASVANIPWLGRYFIGYIAGFLWRGKVYRFATYLGSRRRTRTSDNQVELSFQSAAHELTIRAQQATGVDLRSPLSGSMTGKVNESLEARIEVTFCDRRGNCLYHGAAFPAGLEVAGDDSLLQASDWTR